MLVTFSVSSLISSTFSLTTAASVLVTTGTASFVNLSRRVMSQTTFSSGVTVSATVSSPVTQSSSVAVIPPGTFVRFVISVPMNQSVSDISFRANLTKGILTAYQNGTLGGITGNVSVNVSKRKNLLEEFLHSIESILQVLFALMSGVYWNNYSLQSCW